MRPATRGPRVTGHPASAWNIANILTVLRIAIVPLFAWLLLVDDGQSVAMRLWATGCFVLAIVTDRIDGELARNRGLVTDFGKVADPIADKALIGMAFIGLSLIEVIPWWVTVLVLFREWSITALRFVMLRHRVMPASRGGKVKTALQSAALTILILPLFALPLEGLWRVIAWVVLTAAVVVTVVTGLDYVAKAVSLHRSSAQESSTAGPGGPPR